MSAPQLDRRPVAVICVTHNSSDHLEGFVASIAASDIRRDIRLIFVDSGSTDDTVGLAANLAPWSDVCELPANRGYGAGLNAGISFERATGRATTYVVANPDVRPSPSCIRLLVDTLIEPSCGITTPVLVDENGHRQDTLGQFPTTLTTWTAALLGNRSADRLGLPVDVLCAPRHYAHSRNVGWATGGLLGISAVCANQTGPWPEHLFMYEEEVEYCRQARRAGFTTTFVPEAVAVREVGHDQPERWRHALMRANRVSLAAGRQRLGVASGLIVGDLLRASRPQARAGLWAITHGATPQQILRRYLPSATIEFRSADAAPSQAEAVHRALSAESSNSPIRPGASV